MPPGGKPYTNEKPMKVLTLLGGLATLISLIVAVSGMPSVNIPIRIPWTKDLSDLTIQITGIVISSFTILYAIKPGKFIPFNVAILLLLGTLMILFGGMLSIGEEFQLITGILIFIAAILGLFEKN
jgi:hypothetical protein